MPNMMSHAKTNPKAQKNTNPTTITATRLAAAINTKHNHQPLPTDETTNNSIENATSINQSTDWVTITATP